MQSPTGCVRLTPLQSPFVKTALFPPISPGPTFKSTRFNMDMETKVNHIFVNARSNEQSPIVSWMGIMDQYCTYSPELGLFSYLIGLKWRAINSANGFTWVYDSGSGEEAKLYQRGDYTWQARHTGHDEWLNLSPAYHDNTNHGTEHQASRSDMVACSQAAPDLIGRWARRCHPHPHMLADTGWFLRLRSKRHLYYTGRSVRSSGVVRPETFPCNLQNYHLNRIHTPLQVMVLWVGWSLPM